MDGNKIKIIRNLLLVTVALTTILAFPWKLSEPISLPRFSLLILCATFIGIYSLFTTQVYKSRDFTILNILVLSFGLWMYISLLFCGIRLADGLYGFPGRNLGVLTYTALLIIFITSACVSSRSFIYNIIQMIQLVGIITIIYSLSQLFGMDPIKWDSNEYKVIGFFGNPNFLAAFLGILVVVTVPDVLNQAKSMQKKILPLLVIFFSIYIIIVSDSQQGFLIIISGGFTFLYFWIKSKKELSRYIFLVIPIFFIGIMVGILDLLQKLPWKSIFYQPSISYRGDYWRAAWKAGQEHPIFGIGFDNFINYYRKFRDESAVNRVNSEARLDSAHNIFLDMFLNGGLPMLIIYIVIIFYTLYIAYQNIIKAEKLDLRFISLFGAWIGFLIQSTISINMISHSILGWLMSGALIGYNLGNKMVINQKLFKLKKAKFISLFLATCLSIKIIFPLLLIDAEFKTAFLTADATRMQKLALKPPIHSERIYIIASTLRLNGYPSEALQVSKKGILIYPYSIDIWSEIYNNPLSNSLDKSKAIRVLRLQDTLNSELRLGQRNIGK